MARGMIDVALVLRGPPKIFSKFHPSALVPLTYRTAWRRDGVKVAAVVVSLRKDAPARRIRGGDDQVLELDGQLRPESGWMRGEDSLGESRQHSLTFSQQLG